MAREPKTKAGRRTIPLSPAMAQILANQIKWRETIMDACCDKWSAKNRAIADEGYLFITSHGNVSAVCVPDQKMRDISRQIGIQPITPHGLRHTFATRWVEAGLDIRSLAEILGHADVKMTLNIYAHSLPEQKRKNMDFLSSQLSVE